MIHIFLLEIVSGWVTLTHFLEAELLELIYYFYVMINIQKFFWTLYLAMLSRAILPFRKKEVTMLMFAPLF